MNEERMEIFEDLFLEVTEFKGKRRVDLRKYYHNKEGEALPTKKGISFTVEEWEDFAAQLDDIQKFVKERLPKKEGK